MKISTLNYCAKQGLKNIRNNKMFSLASIGTIVACLFLFGILLSVVLNFQYMMKTAEEQVGITVFFQKGIEQEQIDEIGNLIKARPEVAKITFTSGDEAWQKFSKEVFGDDEEILEGFDKDNPLKDSASYEIHLNDITKQNETVEFVEGLEGVRQVNSSDSTAAGLTDLNMLASYASVAIIIILLGVAVFLISNTITIGISVRKEEISIMKYIGATDFFVRAPFIIEGLIIGIIGSIIPIGLLYIVYDKVVEYVITKFHMIANIVKFLPPRDIIVIMAPFSLLIGIGIGLVGSIVTIRKHLRV